MSISSVTLVDSAARSQADVLVGYGFNCYRFCTEVDGQQVDLLWAAEDFESGRHRPSGSGIPLLFPFPGRIKGTELSWEGRTYSLQEGDGRGNAIHGFVHARPWRVISQSEQHVTGQFQAAVDDPLLLKHWPSDFGLTATYRLDGQQLTSTFELFNSGDVTLPCGFGTHPYFRVPLTPAGQYERCRLVLPVSEQWVLDGMNATGERETLTNATALQRGVELADLCLDNVFCGLVETDGRMRARIEDPASRLATEIEFAAPFRECVVYTPGDRQAVCIEPYTCVPDPFRLQRQGIDAGLIQLEPGARITAEITIRLISL